MKKTFICEICGKKYSQEYHYLNHMKTKHPEVKEEEEIKEEEVKEEEIKEEEVKEEEIIKEEVIKEEESTLPIDLDIFKNIAYDFKTTGGFKSKYIKEIDILFKYFTNKPAPPTTCKHVMIWRTQVVAINYFKNYG